MTVRQRLSERRRSPAVGDLEPPPRDKPRANECRVYSGVAFSEAVPAGLHQGIPWRKALCEKAEPLEDCAVSEAVTIGQEDLIIALAMRKVDGKTVGNVLDTAAEGWVTEHIDDRAVEVRDGDLCAPAPDGLRAEEVASIDVLERERRALTLLRLLPHRTGGEGNDVTKDLLGEVPVLGGAAASDVCGTVEDRNQDPGVLKNMDALEGIQACGSIDSGTDASQPTLTGPPREDLGSLRAGDGKSAFCIGDADHVASRSQDPGEASAGGGHGWFRFRHSISFIHKFA